MEQIVQGADDSTNSGVPGRVKSVAAVAAIILLSVAAVSAIYFVLFSRIIQDGGVLGSAIGLDPEAATRVAISTVETPALPYLGITYIPINAKVAQQYELAVDCGVLLTAVAPGSPADHAGLRPGDILQSFEDQALTPDISLLHLLWQQHPGSSVSVIASREGERYTTEIVLGNR